MQNGFRGVELRGGYHPSSTISKKQFLTGSSKFYEFFRLRVGLLSMTDEVFFPVLSLQRQAKKGSEERFSTCRKELWFFREERTVEIHLVCEQEWGLNYGHCVVLLKMFNIKFICLIYRHNFVKAVG